MPMSPESKHCINARTLGLMKPTAYLINTSRGGVIHEPDLYEALKNRRIAGAGLDVFDEEPPGASHPLLTLDNVVYTPHMAGVDTKSRDDMAVLAATAIARLLKGDWPADWVVNPQVKEKFFARGA
jgi:phosphoglycerate dehydrogenase-like enzyme